MNELKPKRPEDSASEEIQIVLSQHLNGYDRLFGGQLAAWIDILAGVVARRHANCNVTTACIDNLRFRKAAHVNDIIVLRGRITHVGHTSMEVRVDTYIEDITGLREQINTAYLVMDLLNAEALIQVKVSFSSVLEYLNQLPAACQEAGLALNAGKIFYPDQNVYPYNKLGIGRLIYGLSRERCSAYLKEVLGTDSPDFFQPETVHVINSFLDHNMNIAETTRHLHMHRNTLIYRLEQIQKETGLDIRQFHDAMTIKTVLFVLNYIDNSQSPAAESGQ